MMMNSHVSFALVVLFLFLFSGTAGTVLADECSGIIATGSVVCDGRSILEKNRHFFENNQRPIFGKGTYVYWGIGDWVTSFCRMGMNEKGLAIADFDAPPGNMIDDGIWQYTSDAISPSEDDDMRTVLGDFTTVEDAAMWLAHHASHPCQWGIISQEPGIGAIVAMDANFHANITYIHDEWCPIGNVWHCENASSSNTQRIDYLVRRYLNTTDTLDVKDVVRLLGRDIQSSGSNESEPAGYNGTYQAGGLTPSSCRSAAAFLSGDNRFDGALSMAWVAIGQTTHLCLFFPLGASYLQTAADIPANWTNGIGLEQYADVKQVYAEASPDVYYRSGVHDIYNYSLPIQETMFDRYETCMDSVKNSMSKNEIIEKMRSYANSTFEESLQAYIEERLMSSVENKVTEPDVLPLNLLILVSFLSLISAMVLFLVFMLLSNKRS